jgi:phosphate transport system permease protein
VPAFEKFGLGFFFTNVWDPVKLNFGALAPIYGTLVTSLIALLIGVPGQLRHRALPDRDVPRVLKRPLGTAVELLAAIPVDHLRDVGLFVFAPVFGTYVQPLLTRLFGDLWILGPLFRARPTGSACCRRASSCR